MRHFGSAALAVAICVAACTPHASGNSSATVDPSNEPESGVNAAVANGAEAASVDNDKAVASGWSYDTSKDEMRGTTTSYARVDSENTISLGFPYDADNARLTIRKRSEDGTSVMIHAPGQFLCNSYNDDTVAVKFDSGPIQRFSCSEPDDATTGVLFINSEARFVSKLKSSKRVIIEANFFQAGRQQMIFKVGGLDWPQKAQ